MAKQHAKRFIIEVKAFDGTWRRSGNFGLTNFFLTREEAQTALNNGETSSGLQYRVRMK